MWSAMTDDGSARPWHTYLDMATMMANMGVVAPA